MQAGTLLRSSLLVTVLNVAGLGAGFLLQMLLASAFGATAITDAYLAAATIPTLLNTIFLTSLNITFIPVFVEYSVRGNEEEAWRVAGSFIVIVTAGLSVLVTAGIYFSQPIIGLIAPGLIRTPETWHLAAELQRILLPASVFTAAGGLLAGIYYARSQFVVPTMGPLVANVTAVILAVMAIERLGVHGLAWGVLGGAVTQLLFLFWPLRNRARELLSVTWNHPGVAQILRLMLPWLFAAAIYKANPVVDRLVASQFSAGAISILGFAYMIVQLATVVASKGVSIAIFPALSRLSSEGRPAELVRTIDGGLRLVTTAIVPLMVLLALGGKSVVGVLFERGAFSANDSSETATAILAYLAAFIALSVGNVTGYVFYALQDTKTPAIIGCVGMGVNLLLALTLRDTLGFLAPAVSFSIMGMLNVTISVTLLRRRLGALVLDDFWPYVLRTVLAGTIMALAWWAVTNGLPAGWQPPLPNLLAHVTISAAAFAAVWALANRAIAAAALTQLRYRLTQRH